METEDNIPNVLKGLMVRKQAMNEPKVGLKVKIDSSIRDLDLEDKRKTMNINYVSVHDKVRRQLGNVVMKMKFASDYEPSVVERLPVVEYNMKLDDEFVEKPVVDLTAKPETKEFEEVEESEEKVEREEEEEKEEEEQEEKKKEKREEEVAKEKKKVATKIPKMDIATGRLQKTEINGRPIETYVPKQTPIEKLIIRAPSYYMNNRKMYTQKLVSLFKSYFAELEKSGEDITCESRGKSGFDALIHQRIVRDYLNLYTPYRGLLLYHGLGSGKTCTSIAIAEGMKTHKKVIVMTPASLKMNFFSELKKCGDVLYKKNQYWQFISVEGKPEYVAILSQALSLPVEFIMENKGAWLMDIKKTPNYGTLTGQEQKVLDKQLDTMIRTKYTDINYNGLTLKKYNEWTRNDEINPFDHSVVLIDEAHNLISRIMNKLNNPTSLAYKLYGKLLTAQDVRIVLMSGTPIINYPHEIAILFNILRGVIKTWTFKIKSKGKLEEKGILNLLEKSGVTTYDYINYAAGKLTITRNPFGFVNMEKAAGLKLAPGLEDKPARKIKIAASTVAPKKGGDPLESDDSDTATNKPVDVPAEEQTGAGGVGSGRRKGAKKFTIKVTKHPVKKTKKIVPKIHIDESRDVIEIDTTEGDLVEPTESSMSEEMEMDLARDRMNLINNMGEDNIHRGGAIEINPKYSGVKLDQQGNISDSDFLKQIERAFESADIHIDGEPVITVHKCLPDSPIDFNQAFIDEQTLMFKRSDIFKKRILGLTSYFRSAQEALLPRFILTEDGKPYHIVKVEMSDFQFSAYSAVRGEELTSQKEMSSARKMGVFKVSSSYRTRSRAASNFVFPAEIERPLPQHIKSAETGRGQIQAADLDNIQDDNELDMEENGTGKILSVEYAKKIQEALNKISQPGEGMTASPYLSVEGLRNLSPKFLKIMQTIQDPANEGLHLVYSAFRSVEGIGLLRLIFMANGFSEFKLVKSGETWDIVDEEGAGNKPRFVLYTGTETADEKELIRNIYNSNWDALPINISSKLREKAENNYYGDIIKIFMITSSGAEGINLENTRFVHIVEPYWHMVRIDQVVGRARRICSHMNLPEELRTLQVFIYLATFTGPQKNDKNLKIMTSDVSRLTGQPYTTDESLFEIATIKDGLISQIMRSVKETAIDCQLYAKSNQNEKLVCYGYGKTERNEFGSYPTFEEDQQFIEDVGVREKKVEIGKKEYEGKTYIFNKATKEIYEPVAIKQGTVIVIGHMEKQGRELVPVLHQDNV